MGTKHTPGPWTVERDSTVDGYTVWRASSMGDLFIAQVKRQKGEEASNARLIAAAPDLLAACAKALDYLGRIEEASEGAELRDLLRAAIAKAEAQS